MHFAERALVVHIVRGSKFHLFTYDKHIPFNLKKILFFKSSKFL